MKVKKYISLVLGAALLLTATFSHPLSTAQEVRRRPISVSGGCAAFTPPDSSNLVLWLEADVGVYNDAGSTLATNGQTVQQWNDQSGNGHNVSQATSGARPTYVTGVQHGQPVVRFSPSGTADLMSVATTADLDMNGNSTVIMVLKFNGSPASINALIGKGNAYYYYLNGNLKQEVDRPFNTNGALAATDLGNTIFHGIAAVVSGTGSNQVAYFVNGTADGTTTLPSVSTSASDFEIGHNTCCAQSLSADIGEIAVYKTGINSTDRGSWFTYLSCKWAY